MPLDDQTLTDDATCISQCIPQGMYWPVLIAIFARIAGMPVDTNALIAEANCISQCIPVGMQLPVLIALASDISGGGSAGGGITCGTGAPTSTPSSGCALYIQTDSIPLPGAYWSYYDGSWHQV